MLNVDDLEVVLRISVNGMNGRKHNDAKQTLKKIFLEF